ncbi:hypothetical protein PRIPAC_75527, partial [Pristionchus pacificus]|uniref:Uncharacterized protein n=1 Tax=Pristionchus pacificus TaxID=54126 RepID=A0A2A6BGC6_PRIPA
VRWERDDRLFVSRDLSSAREKGDKGTTQTRPLLSSSAFFPSPPSSFSLRRSEQEARLHFPSLPSPFLPSFLLLLYNGANKRCALLSSSSASFVVPCEMGRLLPSVMDPSLRCLSKPSLFLHFMVDSPVFTLLLPSS